MFGYDLKQAATYFLKDDEKYLKITVLYLLSLASFILSSAKHFSPFYLLLIPPIIYLHGYMAKNNNLRILKHGDNLPELKEWKDYFVIGLKFLIGCLLFGACCTLLLIALAFVLALVLSPILFLLHTNPAMLTLGTALMVIFGIIGGVFLMLSALAVQIAFSINLKFKSFFDFKLIKKIMFQNYKSFMQLISVCAVVGLINLIILVILALTKVGMILMPLVSAYLFLIMSDLYGQFISKSIKPNEG